ncbi:COG complex component [Peniophora sp. CONT]|nr:COG complex component [Peniophora sp. CONT]
MSVLSPQGSTSRDPFELERLAQELAEREQLSPGYEKSFSIDGALHELPSYAPLSHSNPYFTAETFNVEDFLLSRTHTSLPDLRSELRDYLATLKEELVKLINDDYEAFISLSTDLRGEGARLEHLKMPLGDLKEEIAESRNGLQQVQDDIESRLKQRVSLREEKAYLHLLLKISESVTRLESLLLIASTDSPTSPPQRTMSLSKSLSTESEDGPEDRSRGSRAKHLSRVAAEYTQLLYHVAKAQADGQSAFIDDIQWRINRIQSTLSSDLDHLFSQTLSSLSDANKGDRSKLMIDVTECLRTYDIMGLWRDAEDVLRRDVVREFVKKTIFPGALNAPHSPILPTTPFAVRSKPPITAGLPPRTPYTPFTAFAPKGGFFDVPTSTSANLLDDYDNPLAGLYNSVLKFVERDLKQIMDIAEKIHTKSTNKAPADSVVDQPTFNIMANVVWTEIGRAILDDLGSVVFAAGKPSEFRKHHETTQAFIRALQYMAPSATAVDAMVKHPVFTSVERRWQLPVYFQLRWKEIVAPLEETLSATKLEPNSDKSSIFASKQAAALWAAVEACWSGEVFMPQLSHRFWKLTLQALSRYRTWLERNVSALDSSAKPLRSALEDKGGTPNSPRPGTPSQSAEPSAVETAAEDANLRQMSLAMVDIKALDERTWQFWREAICIMLPDPQEDEAPLAAEDALRATLSTLTDLQPIMSAQIVAILSRRACDALAPVRTIPAQLRGMSSKKMPTTPSYFVDALLRPVRLFFGIDTVDGPGTSLKDSLQRPYTEEVFENVVQRFISHLTALKKNEDALRRLKKGKKPTFALFGGGGPSREDESRDEQRIRAQMILDVDAFGKDAEKLGVDVKVSPSFRALDELVHASFMDETTSGA